MLRILLCCIGAVVAAERDYIAAVYQHASLEPWNEETPHDIWKRNIDVFEEQAGLASQQKADIILFPELVTSRFNLADLSNKRKNVVDLLHKHLHNCPEPEKDPGWIPCDRPCDHPTKYQNTYPLCRLSCMAKESKIWVASGSFCTDVCDPSTDENCHSDGPSVYNVVLIFDTAGRYVERYRTHLSSSPSNLRHCESLPIFETDFARFALIISFDSFFKCPTVDLIEKKGIRNILFPTPWVDIGLSPALIWQQGIAAGLNVNLIASNNMPRVYKIGSGIYSGRDALAYTYEESKPLLIANVPNPPKSPSNTESEFFDENLTLDKYKPLPYPTNDENAFFAWTQFFGKYTNFASLKDTEGSVEVCEYELCCSLTYKRDTKDELFVFGAASGYGCIKEQDSAKSPRGIEHKPFVQDCVLLKCPTNELASCGGYPEVSSTVFQRFEIIGNFSSRYLFPGVLTSDHSLPDAREWDYTPGRLWSSNGIERPLVAARIMARLYDKDKIDPR